MQEPSVRIVSGGDIVFSSGFNVALPFIDRHLEEGRGSATAIRCRQGDVTYAELASSVNRAANALTALGIRRGERVLMIVKDCPEFYYVFWGAIKAGIVPVPVNTLLRAKDYAFIVADSECAALVYSPEYAAEVEPALAASLHAPAHVLAVESGTGSLTSLLDAAPAEFEAVRSAPDAECFWLYSSGSTGSPKGAVHLHRDMVVTSHYYGTLTLGVTEGDVCFSAAKLFFAYGLGNGMTFPLWAGATAVLLDGRPTPESTFETIERYKPTLYFGVPTLYGAQLDALERLEPDLSSVRACVSAGEALPPGILRRWKERTGLDILDGIGSTEALHIFISNRPGDVKPGASGKVVRGYEAVVVDEEGRERPAGEPGWLLIRGGSMAKYYWRNPEKTAATMLDDGWLNTGDTYFRDADGYFYYCGRSDDMLKVGGIWCSPFEIESTLIEHPQVAEVAVVGRADAQRLIKPEAWIVLRNGAEPGAELEADLLRHCKAKMAPYKYPRHFHFVSELPKTATGKIQRFRLRDAEA